MISSKKTTLLPSLAKCRGSFLHDFQTIFDVPEATMDVCKRCKKRIFTRKDPNGRSDNRTYYKHHRRDFLRPVDKEFAREYNKNDYGLSDD